MFKVGDRVIAIEGYHPLGSKCVVVKVVKDASFGGGGYVRVDGNDYTSYAFTCFRLDKNYYLNEYFS